MKNHLRQIRNAVMAVLPFFGRFGSQPDTSPESYIPTVEIEGGGPGKAASRHRNRRPDKRKAGIDHKNLFVDYRRECLFNAMMKDTGRAGRIPGSLRGRSWLRMGRLMRSAGL